MLKTLAEAYRCPTTGKTMKLDIQAEDNGVVFEGTFLSGDGNTYRISNGIPDFIGEQGLPDSDLVSKEWYDKNADVYDEYLPLTFMTFNEDEDAIRNKMIDKLELKDDAKVLELGAGTGRDSIIIADRLSKDGELFLQDISAAILEKGFNKLSSVKPRVEYHIGNACSLPFPDNYFDAVYHFGGLNTFSDIASFFSECNRVAKTDAKIVVGDESMPVWLRETEFGKILMNSNPHYKYNLPLEHLSTSSRNVRLEWIIGGVFYVIDYSIGEGDPEANFDFNIPGPRGGTHRTRYYGHIEGVTEDTKKLAVKARGISGKSMHQWLDSVIRDAALAELDKEK